MSDFTNQLMINDQLQYGQIWIEFIDLRQQILPNGKTENSARIWVTVMRYWYMLRYVAFFSSWTVSGKSMKNKHFNSLKVL